MKQDEAMTWIFILLVLAVVVAVLWGLGFIILGVATVGAVVLDLVYMAGGA